MSFSYSANCPANEIRSFIEEWHSDALYFEAKTSGSTGQPKVIKIEKSYARASAIATVNFLQLKAGDKALMSLNPQTIGGKMMMVRALIADLDLYCVNPSANPFLELDQDFDFVSLAPIQLAASLDHNPDDLKNCKNIIVGGGVISTYYAHKLKEHQLTVYQTFGMTETLSHIALRKVGFEPDQTYHTLPGVTVSSDKNNDTLIIHAPQIGQPELRTNDIVKIESSTSFDWIGRIDFTVNTGGIKVQIEKLEKLIAHKISLPFFIWKQPHLSLGEEIILIIEGEIETEWLTKLFYDFLPRYHRPKKIGSTHLISRTPSDKIRRQPTFEQVIATNGLLEIL